MAGQQPEAPAIPGITRLQPKRVTMEAHQWFRNGDHPGDNCRMITPDPRSLTQFAPFLSEGEVVRYYRNPDDDGQRECGDCGSTMHDHGWIDQGIRGRVVCPGDWVVSLPLSTPGLTAYFPVAADVFAGAYEPAGAPVAESPSPAPPVPSGEAGGPAEGGEARTVLCPGCLYDGMLERTLARAEAAEAKLAAITDACRSIPSPIANRILAIIGTEEETRDA